MASSLDPYFDQLVASMLGTGIPDDLSGGFDASMFAPQEVRTTPVFPTSTDPVVPLPRARPAEAPRTAATDATAAVPMPRPSDTDIDTDSEEEDPFDAFAAGGRRRRRDSGLGLGGIFGGFGGTESSGGGLGKPAGAAFFGGLSSGISSARRERLAREAEDEKWDRMEAAEAGKSRRAREAEEGRMERFEQGEEGRMDRLERTERGKSERLGTTEEGKDWRAQLREDAKDDRAYLDRRVKLLDAMTKAKEADSRDEYRRSYIEFRLLDQERRKYEFQQKMEQGGRGAGRKLLPLEVKKETAKELFPDDPDKQRQFIEGTRQPTAAQVDKQATKEATAAYDALGWQEKRKTDRDQFINRERDARAQAIRQRWGMTPAPTTPAPTTPAPTTPPATTTQPPITPPTTGRTQPPRVDTTAPTIPLQGGGTRDNPFLPRTKQDYDDMEPGTYYRHPSDPPGKVRMKS